MALTPGIKLGQYEILAPLGAGSMGEVYRARDSRLNRDVAIKVLPQMVSLDPERRLRFEQEAQSAAVLNHPNILAVFQMDTYNGMPYMVTELLEGKTLTESVRRGPLPARKAIDFGTQIARGLAAAHEKGMVHRDLKPDNIFVTKEGHVKILDFGLAKFVQLTSSVSSLSPTITAPGIAIGTVGYMSPEQVRGLIVDHRSDIFALGAILYEMLMGKAAFQRETSADTMSAILNQEPPSILQVSPDLPLGLDRVVRRCLEKNPEQRFQSASDLAFALEALSDPETWSPSGSHPILREAPNRRLALFAVVLIAVLIAGLLAFQRMRPAPRSSIANYVQLTHDGQPKSLIGTDGARIYLGLGAANSTGFFHQGIAEMSVAGGEPRKLDRPISSEMAPVDLSPDGTDLLVIEGQGAPPTGPLRRVPVLSGSPRRIGDFIAETAALSPDGKALVYTRLGDLFLANADGTESRKLLSVKGDIKHVAWSPDSLRLRFDSSETTGTLGQQMQWDVSADGTDLHRLLENWHNPPDECCGRWSADGKYFAFQSQGQIWALPSHGSLFSPAPNPIPLTSSPMSLSSPLPSKDGKNLFFIGRTYRGELNRYDQKSASFKPFLGGISAEYIAISSDGQWVTYVSYPDGAMWRSKIDGSERLQLTYPPMSPLLPRWSPDGKTILFFEFTRGGQPARMYQVSADGGNPRLLLPSDHSQQLDPNWSPDGSKIVFANESNDPSSAIHILDTGNGKLSDLPGSQGLYSPRWSPDGRYISAFSPDSRTVLCFNFQTQKWAELASGSLSWLNWSHDSRYVYVLDRRGKDAVVRIRVSDRHIEQVSDLQAFVSTGRYGGALALTPDDQPLILRDTGTQDVYSVDWNSQ